MNAKVTIGIVALALALTLAAGVSGAPTRASGTLQLRASFTAKWTADFVCPPGLPATNSCYVYVGDAVVPGLGHVTEKYAKTFDGNRDAPCVRTLPNPVVEVAGKGEIELSTLGPECMGLPPTQLSFDASINGGSGMYAGASGSVHVESHVSGRPGVEGTAIDIWTGTLTVPGLDFELTPPTIQGAVSKTVRAPRNAKRMRVRYAVTAQDAVDGSVPVSCTPRSGAFFRLGRTKVTCSATDSSGNTRQARFTITVSRRASASRVGASAAQQGGLYVALGDSIAAGNGASSVLKSYVQLYYGYLQSNGSGVTDLLNRSRAGATSTNLRNERLAAAVAVINESSDTKAVTISIGLNDVEPGGRDYDPNCPTANAPACPLAGNLRAILAALNTALATDPGDETVQLMEYYNPDIGTPNQSATRQLLLGSDGKVDCSATGAALGLNDLIHCISIEQGATPVDVLPIFDAAGEAFLAADHRHPNDAGHLAIAKAFGGAATPTAPQPPPSPPNLRAGKPKLSRATAGKPFTAWMLVTNADTGEGVKGQVTCQGKLSGKSLRAKSHSSASTGRSYCTWQLPATAHGKQFKGSITSSFQGSVVSRSFSTKVK